MWLKSSSIVRLVRDYFLIMLNSPFGYFILQNTGLFKIKGLVSSHLMKSPDSRTNSSLLWITELSSDDASLHYWSQSIFFLPKGKTTQLFAITQCYHSSIIYFIKECSLMQNATMNAYRTLLSLIIRLLVQDCSHGQS